MCKTGLYDSTTYFGNRSALDECVAHNFIFHSFCYPSVQVHDFFA